MGSKPTVRACALAFLVAWVTLFVQVLVHRMISAKLLNNFAFLAISLTMLGFALSGVLLSRWLAQWLARRDAVLLASAALFALTLVAATAVFYRADVGVLYLVWRPEFVRAFLRCVPLALLYGLPFVFCGMMLGLLLADPALPASRVYAFDLAGSALGALAVIPAIAWLGTERAAVIAAALLLAGTAALVPPRTRLPWGLAALATVALAIAGAWPERVFVMRTPPGSPVAKAQAEGRLERTVWDPVSRIELMGIDPPDPQTNNFPVLFGERPEFLARFRKMLSQNNNAPAFAVDWDGRPESLEGIEQTIYAAAYEASTATQPRAVAIGVGGGFDLLTALHYGARVTGVEVNGATLRILTRDDREYFRALVEHPQVRLVHAEGRSYLATTNERLDVLQVSGVDSYTGTAAAAHVFSESYLYTVEAFALYLSRLDTNGIMNMMRLEYEPPHEMLRVLVTAVAALRQAGFPRPEEHIAMVAARNRHFAALLLKRTPFTPTELARLEAWAAGSRILEMAAAPGRNSAQANVYQAFLELGEPRLQEAFVASYPFDISPVTDDRPFFFRRSFWWHLFPSSPLVWAATPALEYGLILLLAIVGCAVLVCVYLPMRWSPPAVRPPHWRRYLWYFAGAGIGYLVMEMALIQKFGLFLGHPNYALSVVLSGLLLGTGIGSMASGWTVRTLRGIRFVSYCLALLLLGVLLVTQHGLGQMAASPFVARCAVTFALVMPLGFLLGTFLPWALERLKREAPGMVPWAWGINGIFSVLAPILAVGVSVTWGVTLTALISIPVYLGVGLVLPAVAPAGSDGR